MRTAEWKSSKLSNEHPRKILAVRDAAVHVSMRQEMEQEGDRTRLLSYSLPQLQGDCWSSLKRSSVEKESCCPSQNTSTWKNEEKLLTDTYKKESRQQASGADGYSKINDAGGDLGPVKQLHGPTSFRRGILSQKLL